MRDLPPAGGRVSEDDLRAQFFDEREDSAPEPAPQSVAVIPIQGVLARRMNMMTQASGGTSLADVSKALRAAAASDTVKAIVLDIDSPGGEVMGITEFHAEILRARSKKPVIAHASGIAASAAYWLASAAQEITATPSAMLGSIGVIGVHIDESKAMADSGLGVTLKTAGKFKADASGLTPLSEEGEAELQRRVEQSFDVMIRDIAKGRGLPVARVRKDFGDARIVEPKLALELGMIDRIETFEDTLARAGGKSRTRAAGQPGRVRVTGATNIEPLAVGEVVTEDTVDDVDEVAIPVVPQGAGDALAQEIATDIAQEIAADAASRAAYAERARIQQDADRDKLHRRS